MKQMTFNNRLTFAYDDSFVEMRTEELKNLFVATDNRRGICDPQRHIVISVCHSKPGILCYLTDAQNVLRGAECAMKKKLTAYRRYDTYPCTVASKKACAMRFEFIAPNAKNVHRGEMLVFRDGNRFYALTFITGADAFEQNRPTLQEVLSSLKLCA